MKTIRENITTLFLDIGGVLLTSGYPPAKLFIQKIKFS
jgi:hypothetical protein